MKKPENPKERNLVKGAIMRVFSRSDLRRQALQKSVIVGFLDPSRPRVKTWCRCEQCGVASPKSYMEIDHIKPKIALDSALELMSWDELVDNTWCDLENLQALCSECHDKKTKLENKMRRAYKKERKI